MTTQAAARPGRGTWAIAISRLRRNRAAMLAAVALVLIAAGTLLAPVYASHVAHTDPFASNLSGMVQIDGRQVAVIQPNDSGLG